MLKFDSQKLPSDLFFDMLCVISIFISLQKLDDFQQDPENYGQKTPSRTP